MHSQTNIPLYAYRCERKPIKPSRNVILTAYSLTPVPPAPLKPQHSLFLHHPTFPKVKSLESTTPPTTPTTPVHIYQLPHHTARSGVGAFRRVTAPLVFLIAHYVIHNCNSASSRNLHS